MQVLKQHRGNMFAANGIGILYAEKSQWDIAKELFTQVRKGKIFIALYDNCELLEITSAI